MLSFGNQIKFNGGVRCLAIGVFMCLVSLNNSNNQVHAGSGLVTEHTWGSSEGVACQGFSKGANNIAISDSNYNGGGNCGKCVRITGDGGSAVAMIVDQCMGCVGVGSIFDLPPGLFKRVTGVSYDIKPVKYEYVDCNDLGSSRDPETDGGASVRLQSEPEEDPDKKDDDDKKKGKKDDDDKNDDDDDDDDKKNDDDDDDKKNDDDDDKKNDDDDDDKKNDDDDDDNKNNDDDDDKKNDDGKKCKSHDDCSGSDFCGDGKCKSIGGKGDSCDSHNECEGDLHCSKGRCKE